MDAFADDTVILSVARTENEPKRTKSTHVDLTSKSTYGISIFMDGIQIPYANTAKYLGMTLDAY